MELRVLMTGPTISFVNATDSVHYNATYLDVPVVLSSSSAATVTVQYYTSDGTTFTGINSSTLTFLSGVTQEDQIRLAGGTGQGVLCGPVDYVVFLSFSQCFAVFSGPPHHIKIFTLPRRRIVVS
jgi:hypothetical protein